MHLGDRIHDIRRKYNLANGCPCGENPVEDLESTSADVASSLPATGGFQSFSGSDDGTESAEAKADSKTCTDLQAPFMSTQEQKLCRSVVRNVRLTIDGRALPPSVSLPASIVNCGLPRHKWLDENHLLQLLDPNDPANVGMFRQYWCRGVPIIVSNCDANLDQKLWKPEAFLRKFGSIENELVDCSRNVVLVGHQMRRFWEGFECVGKRLRDSRGQPLTLKLKDWPATEDFAKLLPSWFEDLIKALPLPEYTDRTGCLNLASRLPGFFVRPDLGPKMYNAYGSALTPRTGSTNLHLDISDAVNLMVYVGIPWDEKEKHAEG